MTDVPEPAVPEPVGRPAPPPLPLAEGQTDFLATIGQRALARLIDAVVLGVPLFVLVYSASDINPDKRIFHTPLWVQVASLVASALYEVVLITLRGQTVGKMAMGIRVVRVPDGSLPGPQASLVRWLVPVLPALIPIPVVSILSLVVFLAAVWSPYRQGWHDRAAGTVVIRTATEG